MSTTPRTDAAIIASGFQAVPFGFQDFTRQLETQLTEMTVRAMKAEAALAKANATIEDICTGGRLTCDQCLEAMPCNCGHSLRRP
jgi:hypothetical protein